MIRLLIPLLVSQWILGCKSNPTLYFQLWNCYFKVLVYCHAEGQAIFWNAYHFTKKFSVTLYSKFCQIIKSWAIDSPHSPTFFFSFLLKLLLLWKWDQAFRDIGTCTLHRKISCRIYMPLSLCSEWKPLVARIYLDKHLYFLSNTVV